MTEEMGVFKDPGSYSARVDAKVAHEGCGRQAVVHRSSLQQNLTANLGDLYSACPLLISTRLSVA
jgi:hypothetical protein